MKLTINGEKQDKPSVWWSDKKNNVQMINQTIIPFKVEIHSCSTYRETAQAIKQMIVRGAPSIGAAAAYGLTQAIFEFWNKDAFETNLSAAYDALLSARPTAVDLRNGLDEISKIKPMNPENALKKARKFADKIIQEGLKIGQVGKNLIRTNMNLLTHCHTGALALVDHGSALSPIIEAWHDKKRFHVYVDETRPRFQGRLTSWELSQYGINHTVICDSASGLLMARGLVDMIILGADRVTRNGDIANKIGTYNLAVLAHHHNIPFYTAFPTTTYDPVTITGKDIIVEERNSFEIKKAKGYYYKLNKIDSVSVYPKNTKVYNPAFDITPNKLITGYITPFGILNASELSETLITS